MLTTNSAGLRLALVLTVGGALCLWGCSGPDENLTGPNLDAPPGRATLEEPRIGITPIRGSLDGALIPGLRAAGSGEDLVLAGDYGKYVVERTKDDETQTIPEDGVALLPGAVIDAQGARGGVDGLISMTTTVALASGRQIPVAFGEVRAAEESRGGAVVMRAEVQRDGVELEVTQRAVLTRKLPHLVVITEIVNRGDRRSIVRTGDRLRFGRGPVFVPTGPQKTPGETRASWLGYESPGQGYGYTTNGSTPFTAEFYISERGDRPVTIAVDTRSEPRNLGKGEKLTFVRRFRATSDGLPGVRGWIAELAGNSVGSARGKLRAPRGFEPEQFDLELYEGGTFIGHIPVRSSLAFDVPLPPGKYEVVPRGPWGLTAKPFGLNVSGNSSAGDVRFQEVGEVDIRVIDKERNRPMPATVLFMDPQGRPVNLGDGRSATQAGPYLHLDNGQAKIRLAAGTYQIIATRGPRWDIERSELTVQAGVSVPFTARLRRVLDPRGWVRADLRAYTSDGAYGSATPEEVAVAMVASGVDFAVTADRPNPGDLLTGADRAGLAGFVAAAPGAEGEPISPLVGHFVALPGDKPGLATALPLHGTSPRPLLSALKEAGAKIEPFITLVWPRTRNKFGYFDRFVLDETSGKLAGARGGSKEFDGIELLSGESLGKEADTRLTWQLNLQDWMRLTDDGEQLTVVGASGSKQLGHEPVGVPFTWVNVGGRKPVRPADVNRAKVIDALQSMDAVALTGPLVELTIDGKGPGSVVPGKWRIHPKTKKRIRVPHTIKVDVRAANWLGFSAVELWQDGKIVETWDAGTTSKGGVKLFSEKTGIIMPRDGWFFVRVTGTNPIVTLPHRRTLPWAVSNPIWIDANRDGRFKAVAR